MIFSKPHTSGDHFFQVTYPVVRNDTTNFEADEEVKLCVTSKGIKSYSYILTIRIDNPTLSETPEQRCEGRSICSRMYKCNKNL